MTPITQGLIGWIASTPLEERKLSSILVFLSFNLHILGDLLGSGIGWGTPYFWLVKKHITEFSPPFRWELDSWQNLVVTAICIIICILISIKKKRTFIELISLKTDKKVVSVFNNWFSK